VLADLLRRFSRSALAGALAQVRTTARCSTRSRAVRIGLSGLHGNTQYSRKLLGSAVRYGYTGDRDGGSIRRRVLRDRVVGHHTFATGGTGKTSISARPISWHSRTVGRPRRATSTNMLKLTRRLFALEPTPVPEFHERALFNHILGSMDPVDGTTCYMVPVGRAVRARVQDMSRSFILLRGLGPWESHALHGLASTTSPAIGCG